MEGKFHKEDPVDPAQSSMVENNIELKRKRSLRDFILRKQQRYIDQNKEEYFEISGYPELQRFASLLLKGTVNTSDIIKKDGRYFSHIQKAKNVSESTEDAELEFAVDHNLMRFLLEDGDHNTVSNSDGYKVTSLNGWDQHLNVNFGKNNDKVNYFDFEGLSNLEKFKESKYVFPVDTLGPDDKQVGKSAFAIRMQEKIDQLLATIFSEENEAKIKSFEKIIEKSGASVGSRDNPYTNRFFRYKFEGDTKEERTKELFNDLRARLLYLKSKLDNSAKNQDDINQISSELEDLYKPQ
jgi:hypothetical protein